MACCLARAALAAGEEEWGTPNDPAYGRYPADPHQESLFLLDMKQAWKTEKGSKGMVVGVVDLAFDPSHPDLKNKLWTNSREMPGNGKDDDGNGFVDDIHGWDFEDNDNTLEGPYMPEHGNHVAGIIAAETNNGMGIAGMAPNCPLMLVKIGRGGELRDGKIKANAIRYCVDNGARLICANHGLAEHYPGWHVPIGGELKQACDYAYRKGVLVISCTTGNDGQFVPAVFPAAYDSVMGTGASDIFGKPSNIYGGSLFCEVIAPSGERSSRTDQHNNKSIYSCYAGNQPYNYWSGGCMATPHVVGLMALVLSHYPGIDVEQARQIVRNTAKSGKPEFDVRWGYGLIQPVAALSLTRDQIAALPTLESTAVTETTNEDGRAVYAVNVRNAGTLDARVKLSLVQNGRKVVDCTGAAIGLRTTTIHFPADNLPPAQQLTAAMEDLGMARPRVYDNGADVRPRITDQDLSIVARADGYRALAVQVHNDGAADASRAAVIVHEYEPAVPNLTGPASQMIAARVIAVPQSSSARTEFPVSELPGLANLWVEIEQLDVGAPHVSRANGKAHLRAK